MAVETPLHPRQVELESRQRLTQLIVQLAGDARPLLFTNRLETRGESAQLLTRLGGFLRGAMAIGDIALNPEMSGDSAAIVVDAEIVAFDAHRSAIHAAFVRLGVDVPSVKHRAPSRFATLEIMREELSWRLSDELRKRNPILSGVGFVGDGHTLMLKDVIEYRVFVGRVVPLDGLIEHHDEKPIDRLREKQLAQAVG